MKEHVVNHHGTRIIVPTKKAEYRKSITKFPTPLL